MTDIFDDNGTPTPAPVVVPPSQPVLPDSLKDMVGEGKKYASVEAALASIAPAQGHITKIEQENAELRQKVAEAIAVEEVYKKLTEANANNGVTPPVAGLDEASVAALVAKQLETREANAIRVANESRVRDALVGKYGDKAKEVYEAKAKELGVGVDFLNEVVRRSPKAAEELFGVKQKEAGAAPTTPSINTGALSNTRPPVERPRIMVGATTEQLVNAWRAAKPQ